MNNILPEEFFAKINKTIEEANKKQTLIIKAELENIKETIKEEIKKRKELEQKCDLLKNKCENLEKSLNKNNIIIFGLEHNTQEPLIDFIIKSLNNFLEQNLVYSDINGVFTIGKQGQHKPIIVKFTSYLKKRHILQNCSKLKLVNQNRSTKIVIAEQLSSERLHKQKILRKHLSAAKSRKLHAYIKGEKLYINGDPYTAEELEGEDENRNSEDIEEGRESEENDNIRETNSAPATPTVKRQNKETDKEEENRQTATDVRNIKVVPGTSTQTRTSSRRQEKEEKNKKQGTPSERKTEPSRK